MTDTRSSFGTGALRLSVCTTLLLACAGVRDEDSEGKPAGGPRDLSTLAGFAQGLAHAMCENVFECRLGYDDASQMRALLGDVANCTEAVVPLIGDGKQPYLVGIEWAKYQYQADHAERCLSRFAHQCFLFEAEEPSDAFHTICAEVFEGAVVDGGVCKVDAECLGDAYCDNETVSSCGEGVCRPRTSKGATCNRNTQCSTGDSLGVLCSGNDQTPGACVHATQITHVEEGAPCGALIEGEEATLALCNTGLVCAQGGEPAGNRCARPKAPKSDCSQIRECEPGSICLPTGAKDDSGNNLRTCVPFEISAEGESCTGPDANPSQLGRLLLCDGRLSGEHYCDDTDHCAKVRLAAEGESCKQLDCAEGLACSYDFAQEEARCIPKLALGEPCTSDAQCAERGICHDPKFQGQEVCMPDPCL